jgi:uncharacterized protein (TIGR03437 family)
MRKLTIVATALFAPLVLSAQTFPPNADVTKTISLIQSNMRVLAISVDSTGNVYLAGESDGAFTAAANKIGPRGDRDLFVIKTNAAADAVLFSTTIGGSGFDQFRDMKVDSSGNVYLLGSTQSTDIPFTKTTNPTFPVGAFIAKLKSDGTALTYAAQLGSRMNAGVLDVDSSGAAYIAGSANSQDTQATAGAYKQAPSGGVNGSYAGFVMKLSTSGANVDALTYYGDVDQVVSGISVRGNGILLQYQGNMVLLNTALTSQISTTPVGLPSANVAFDNTGNVYWAGANAQGTFAVRKFSSTGQVLLDKTYTSSFNNTPVRIAVSGEGRIFLFGQASGEKFTVKNPTQACQSNLATPNGTAGLALSDNVFGGSGGGVVPPDQAMMVLDPTGNILYSTFVSVNPAQVAVSPLNGHIYSFSTVPQFTSPAFTIWQGVVRFNEDTIPAEKMQVSCLVHGAYFTSVPVTPGTFMTFFGVKMGPTPAVPLTALDSNGRVGSTLGGVSVTVDGKPSAMVYSWDQQINFIVPWGIKTDGSSVAVCLNYQSQQSCIQASTGVARPGAFICDYSANIACALDQNNGVITSANPVEPGKVAQLFMTGFSNVEGTLTDGGVSTGALRNVLGTVTATTAPPDTGCGLFNCAAATSATVPVEFAGNAPGGVLGFDQVNIRIPADMPKGLQSFRLNYTPTGSTKSYPTTIQLYVK